MPLHPGNIHPLGVRIAVLVFLLAFLLYVHQSFVKSDRVVAWVLTLTTTVLLVLLVFGDTWEIF